MQNRLIFAFAIFFCLCSSGFSQPATIDQTRADNFLNGSYWYQKYLPLEDVPSYNTLRNTLVYLKESNVKSFDELCSNEGVKTQIFDFHNKVFQRLRIEMEQQKDKKMKILMDEYKSKPDVSSLDIQYKAFKSDFNVAVNGGNYPQDDICLHTIEELYSKYITRAGYWNPNGRHRIMVNEESSSQEDYAKEDYAKGNYFVEPGDYLRKIARENYDGGDEMQWTRIYEENFFNRDFLPDPRKPDLIYPGEEIRIPQKDKPLPKWEEVLQRLGKQE